MKVFKDISKEKNKINVQDLQPGDILIYENFPFDRKFSFVFVFKKTSDSVLIVRIGQGQHELFLEKCPFTYYNCSHGKNVPNFFSRFIQYVSCASAETIGIK